MNDAGYSSGGVGSGYVPADPPGVETHEAKVDDSARPPSLLTDVVTLFEDAKNYLQAETAFQQSRAAFVSSRLKFAALYGAAAFGVFHLALIAIAVGLVIALAPLVGPWLATLIVGASLIIAGLFFVRRLKSQIGAIRSAFEGESS